MKTIFRTLVILLAGLLVSGALYLAFENMSFLSGTAERPEMPSGETTGLPARPESGDHQDSVSLTRGLSEVGISLVKLTGITLLVLLTQTAIARLPRRRKTRSMIG